jgi:uncharacterized membrane protein
MANTSNGGASRQKTKRLVGLALFTAIVVILQVIATFVKLGPFAITLTLIPIVVGAALYGPGAGAYLGGVFGVVVLIACITGADPGGAILWSANPFLTAVLCLVKGILAGLASGLLYTGVGKKRLLLGFPISDIQPPELSEKLAKRRSYTGVVLAAVASPIVNTGIFLIAMYLFFFDTLVSWAGGTPLVSYVFIGLAGVNFLVELLINIVLCPVVARIIKLGHSI